MHHLLVMAWDDLVGRQQLGMVEAVVRLGCVSI